MYNRRFAMLLGLLLCAALESSIGARGASAQYFGRNKVPYRSFAFNVLRTEHFDVYYYPEESAAVEQAARMAERWYARLAKVLGHELSNRQPLIIYSSHPHFEQTQAIPGELEEGTGGVTESMKRRIVLPIGSSLEETEHVIGHELVHAFQYDMTGRSQGSAAPAVQRLPLWFIEGMAEYLSLGPVDAHTAMWMRDAAYFNRLPTVAKLDDPHFFPYRFGHALWAYIGHRWGDRAIGEVLRAAARSGEVGAGFSAQLGMNGDSLSHEWHRELRLLADRVPRVDPDHEGRALVTARGQIGRYNLAPALSPDGNRVMFLSERDFYSMELFLADAHTGQILRKITKTAIDAHLQGLQFVSGSGAWSPDSRRFAFSTIRDGHPVATVIEAASGRTERLYPLRNVDEVLSLSWSPDGASLAFSALARGHTDLFTMRLDSGAVRQWTDDLPADLQPAWSPDGREIAFVTERFSTNVDSLVVGAPSLALLSVADGSIRALPSFESAKHLNPQWSPDGKQLYAVTDRGGISNVYRLDLASGQWSRVTATSSGVSGITAYSPAFSVAREADRMVFAAYSNGAYNLYAVDSLSARGAPLPDATYPGFALLVPDAPSEGGSPAPTRSAGPDRAVAAAAARDSSTQGLRVTFAPPRVPLAGARAAASDSQASAADSSGPAGAPRVVALLRDHQFGLADTAAFHHSRYRPSLTLDRVSQVALGIGTGGGSGVSGVGGAALYWSDMLGQHNLGTYLQVSSNGGSFVRNVAAIADYQNLRSRLNWGIELSQLPYITRQINTDVLQLPDGTFIVRQRDLRFWQIERRGAATLAYPVSRADRLELSAGYENIDFASELQTRTFYESGDLRSDETTALDTGAPQLSLAVASAAWVHDNSFFGGTSPIAGNRYRFALEPVVGDLQFTGVLADYRTYFMPVRPWTIALRALHYGRYGPGGDSPLLSPLFLGSSSLVRGYDDASFSFDECVDGETGPCPVFERLFGSRLGVVNAEARVPLLGAFGLKQTPGIPPIEAAAFFDAGTAWTAADRAQFLGGDRKTVTSHGLALRANLLGFMIAEIDLVHPNDRPRKGWYWQFSVQPGF